MYNPKLYWLLLAALFEVSAYTEEELKILRHAYLHETDVSELCKQSMIPSIFLSKRVADANSAVMRFSQLELPYSCHISVRTHLGYDMIMVIEKDSVEDYHQACKYEDQNLVVHTMSETDPGYWAGVPEQAYDYKETTRKYYTRKTVEVNTGVTPADNNTDDSAHITGPQSTELAETEKSQDVIVYEIPLLNFTSTLVPGKIDAFDKGFDKDELFDLFYDVTPIPGVNYETELVNLLQVPLSNDMFTETVKPSPRTTTTRHTRTSRKWTARNHFLRFTKHKPKGKHQYFEAVFDNTSIGDNEKTTNKETNKTIDWIPLPFRRNNLTTPTNSIQQEIDDLLVRIKSVYGNKLQDAIELKSRMDSKTNINLTEVLENVDSKGLNKSLYLHPNLTSFTSMRDEKMESSGSFSNIRENTTRATENTKSSIEKEIDDLMAKIKNIYAFNTNPTTTESFNLTEILQHVYKDKYNRSLYLNPDMDKFGKSQEENTRQSTPKTMVYNLPQHTVPVNPIQEILRQRLHTTKNKAQIQKIEDIASHISKNTETKKRNSMITPGPLVDHESWENLVQAAPVMAGLLHGTPPKGLTSKRPRYSQHKLSRKKRFIQPVQIDRRKPELRTEPPKEEPRPELVMNIVRPDNFARMVEVPLDEADQRRDITNLNSFKGKEVIKLCENATSNRMLRKVILIKASRILISMNNFTMSGLTLILTTAMKLFEDEGNCPAAYLECQVVGSRVCIDANSACDGIPNCGFADMYDEDRMKCGSVPGFKHNVYVAALTFLAVLVTALFVIHYWLQRCVPKVADAFFIYTDGVENVLYLNTIMKSPNEDGRHPDTFYQIDNDLEYHGIKEPGKYNYFQHQRRRISQIYTHIFSSIFHCVKKPANDTEIKHKYSFAQMELKRLFDNKATTSTATDAAIQTGSSLELQPQIESVDDFEDEKLIGELNLLKFLNKSSDSDSKVNFQIKKTHNKHEQVSRILNYDMFQSDTDNSVTDTTSFSEMNLSQNQSQEKADDSRKRLRFDEVATIMPALEESESNTPDVKPKTSRSKYKERLSILGPEKGIGKSFWSHKSKLAKK